jgi:hypothetical protein
MTKREDPRKNLQPIDLDLVEQDYLAVYEKHSSTLSPASFGMATALMAAELVFMHVPKDKAYTVLLHALLAAAGKSQKDDEAEG